MIPDRDPVLQSLLASLFTWGVTALGAALVFILPSNSKKVLDVSLGFAAGVMTAASFWSLLAPAIEIAETKFEQWAFLPVAIGFALGAGFVECSDHFIPNCVNTELSLINIITDEVDTKNTVRTTKTTTDEDRSSSQRYRVDDNNGVLRHRPVNSRMINNEVHELDNPTQHSETSYAAGNLSWRRLMLLITAVTVHNIPEGLSVGVGFGSIGKTKMATYEKAFNLALGIGLQNFPEGLAVSLPLAGFGYPKWKAFLYGQLSGMVEPIAAIAGAGLVIMMEPILPYALSFAAGAMIYVVFDSLIHEAGRNGNEKLASFGAVLGFLIMMCMDVGLG
uniref:Zinc transporter ZIP11 n=1 Tax=Panagrolaimus sp. JU765 TaxID=591449 RepID=A0AC34RKL1_9BILA